MTDSPHPGGTDARYRETLDVTERAAVQAYDKTVLLLSGGALGVSFAFLKDVLGPGPRIDPGWLVAAWSAWTASLAIVLMSHLTSHLALRAEMRRFDREWKRDWSPKNAADTFTAWFNILSGVFFVVGAVAMIYFVRANQVSFGGAK
jgi:hypothetical protein